MGSRALLPYGIVAASLGFALWVRHVADEHLEVDDVVAVLPSAIAAGIFAIACTAGLCALSHRHNASSQTLIGAVVGGLAIGVPVAIVSETLLGLGNDWVLAPSLLGLGLGAVTFSIVVCSLSAPRHVLLLASYLVVLGLGLGGGVLVGRSIFSAEESPEVREPVPSIREWAVGDVHVHAAGDMDLIEHPDCRQQDDFLPPRECASSLVDQTLQIAADNGATWVILAEHGPWLGIERENISLGQILGGDLYNPERAAEQWSLLAEAASTLSARHGVRALMGEEIGTAITSVWGHFSAYHVDEYVPNSPRRTPDVEYIDALESAGGWGAINHPFAGGNQWNCWYANSDSDCGRGAIGYAEQFGAESNGATFRAIEVSNGGDFPEPETLEMWDQLLIQGYKVFGVGGSDAHSRSKSIAHPHTGRRNLDKIMRSRTFVFVGERDIAPTESFQSTAREDPIRRGLYAGRVVASNGPFAAASINGVLPGATVRIERVGDVPLFLNLRWEEPFTSEQIDPSTIRVVLAEIRPGCVTTCTPEVTIEPNPPFSSEQLRVPLVMPATWTNAYVRVEVLGSGQSRQLGAFVSPIYLSRSG